jgi:hypothetical protein
MGGLNMTIKLFSVREAAEYLGLKPETVRYHIYYSGYLKGQKVGNVLVFTQDELDHFKQTVPRPGPRAGQKRRRRAQ